MAKLKYDQLINVRTTPEQVEKLKEIAENKTTSQSSLVRQWIDKEHKKIKHSIDEAVLNVASDVSEEIEVGTDDARFLTCEKIINEFGQFSFHCIIDLRLEYYPGEPNNDLGYSFDVLNSSFSITVRDEEVNDVKVLKHTLIKIEKLFQENISFNVYKS